MPSTLSRRLTAEFLGTFWLVLIGCGSAVLAAAFPDDANATGIGLFGVSAAFGLAVVTMAYAVGHLSGGHFNPAVSLGLLLARRLPARDFLPYVVTQVVAATAAAAVLYAVASGKAGFSASESGFAANGYGEHSPGGYSLAAGLLAEVVLTAFFVLVILGSTDRRAPQGFAPLAIGLALVAIHLVGIPVTNTSVNPARSTGQALFVGGWALTQLWAFWVAPLVGAAVAGLAYRGLTGDTGTTAASREGQPVEKARSDAADATVDLTAPEAQQAARGRD
ncbi:aquaporin Z [Kineococcus aurantiacus]|uniref:Aquaporin Z n=1 Tax=Kineococcus aurantiacus TaxID=37633 RepID=A0A7Y9DJD6_9ACTN|nr:aquaporin Z [Kineococcus aurantiacus]